MSAIEIRQQRERRQREMMRRSTLSPLELATLPVICEKWNRIALSTAPADREEAERATAELYQSAGLKAPRKYIWLDSLRESAEIHAHSAHQPASGMWFKLEHLEHYLWRSVRRHFKARVERQVESIIAASVFSAGWSPWRILGWANEPAKHQYSEGSFYANHHVHWLAFAEFFSRIGAGSSVVNLSKLMRIVESCGFFWPGEDRVAFFERPNLLRLDEQRRLHCVDGPALRYPDGVTVYAIHGVVVPAKYIETPADDIDLAEVLHEQNSEVRMAVISKVGFDRLLQAIKPVPKYLEHVCPSCGERSRIQIPRRNTKKREDHINRAVILSQANGNSLVEITIGMPRRGHENGTTATLLRVLHLTWRDKTGPKETVIPVPRSKRQFGRDCPDDINDCEQVRRWPLGWPKEAIAIAET